jgi:hypothetical protein
MEIFSISIRNLKPLKSFKFEFSRNINSMGEVKIPKKLQSTYKYNRRRKIRYSNLQEINRLTWNEASELLGVDIPGLFIYLNHARKIGILKDVRIT